MDHLTAHFRLPLEDKEVSPAILQDEVEYAVEYTRMYLNISRTEYRKVWYRLYPCPVAQKWPNLLNLAFQLATLQQGVKQIFPSLKTAQRRSLQDNH